jgi:hypothetical protein
MKLDAKMIKELIKEATGPSMLLEEPVIAESSFNRIKDKIDKTNVRFVVMSADRHNFSRNENDQRYSELQATFKENGFPFTKLQGAWTEKDDEGNEVRVVEKSLIATEEDRGDVERGESSLFELAKSLTEKYEQDAFIYGWIDETGERQIQARNQAGKYAGYGSWQSIIPVAEDSEFWSRVRGSTFVFKEEEDGKGYGDMFDPHNPYGHPEPQNEEVEVDAPNSVIEAMIKAEMHKGKKIKFVRRKK